MSSSLFFSSLAEPSLRFFGSFKVHWILGRVVTFVSFAASQGSSAPCTLWGTVPGDLFLGLLSWYRIFLGGVVCEAGDLVVQTCNPSEVKPSQEPWKLGETLPQKIKRGLEGWFRCRALTQHP